MDKDLKKKTERIRISTLVLSFFILVLEVVWLIMFIKG